MRQWFYASNVCIETRSIYFYLKFEEEKLGMHVITFRQSNMYTHCDNAYQFDNCKNDV